MISLCVSQGWITCAGNEIIGGQSIRSKNMSHSQINSLINAVKEERITKMEKRTCGAAVVASVTVKKIQQGICQHSLHHKSSG
jgi:hypothetical protein